MNLQFTNKHTGFKFLKREKMINLLPIDVINGQKEEKKSMPNCFELVDCPIFYNVKADAFSVFLPDSFLNHIKLEEITGYNNRNILNISEKTGQYVYFNYESLNELRKVHQNTEFKEDSKFKTFVNQYQSHVMDIDLGIPVIFMAFSVENAKQIVKYTSEKKLSSVIEDAIQTVGAKFEFFKAYKFNDKYYLVNKDGQINKEIFFDFKKGNEANMKYLIMPFSQDDWALAEKINDRVKKIKDDIDSLFKNQEQSSGFDLGITEANQGLLGNSGSNNIRKLNKP